MDIPTLSMSMAQTNLMQQWSIGIMKQALDMTEMQGEMLAEMVAELPSGSTFSAKV